MVASSFKKYVTKNKKAVALKWEGLVLGTLSKNKCEFSKMSKGMKTHLNLQLPKIYQKLAIKKSLLFANLLLNFMIQE